MNTEPAITHRQHMHAGVPFEAKCAWCGMRLGMHRFGDDRCPNMSKRDSNGVPPWGTDTRFARKLTYE